MNKKTLLALAVAAGAAATSASAQNLGSILSGIFGTQPSTPAVVASPGYGSIYTDSYGRRFQYDQYGRQVYLDSAVQPGAVYTDASGRQFQYDQYGRIVYLNNGAVPYSSPYGVAPAAPGGHMISRFYLAQGSLQPGSEAVFVLMGRPGGNAYIDMPSGMRVQMRELQPGVYEGRYVVQWNDNAAAMSQVFGALNVGNATTTTQLENRATTAQAMQQRRWPW
ncbi:hypothetical protein [Ramlibacter albus]|uniref:RHS repeat protein n=1 Tax=Ramlibacter albus TaxID=2079448 RepID=A0A923MC68_9BURK|nr:hypothetical protein [Ramlibacter albus]MBC5767985.1 hypothetical protein [Ramlibacter albus]